MFSTQYDACIIEGTLTDAYVSMGTLYYARIHMGPFSSGLNMPAPIRLHDDEARQAQEE